MVLLGSPGPPQLTAALLDLARRGHVEVWFRHLDTGRPRAVPDVLFERIPHAPDELTDAEAELLERVFSHGDCVAVDTLRRLALRWPPRLVGQLSERVEVQPSDAAPVRRRRGGLAAPLGVLSVLGMLGAVASAALGMLGVAWAVGLAVASVGAALGAERASRRGVARRAERAGRVRSGRTDALAGGPLLAYRRRLAELVEGQTLRDPADCEDLFGPHHAWAIALEVVPDWLALRHADPDPWAGARSPFSARSVSVRRARRLPVPRRREASVRVVHRVPHPREPQE